MYQLKLTPGHLSLAQMRRVQSEPVELSLNPACLARIAASGATSANKRGWQLSLGRRGFPGFKCIWGDNEFRRHDTPWILLATLDRWEKEK